MTGKAVDFQPLRVSAVTEGEEEEVKGVAMPDLSNRGVAWLVTGHGAFPAHNVSLTKLNLKKKKKLREGKAGSLKRKETA